MRYTTYQKLVAAAGITAAFAGAQPAHALLGSFETADGYTGPFTRDVWSYDAGQTGTLFTAAQYNTGRWKELVGSGVANSGAQYGSQHGYIGSAVSPPFALALRNLTPTPGIDFDMTLQYDVGADDTGVAPTTPLQSASITFDICPGITIKDGGGVDTTFNDTRAFSLSFGGTDAAPGATIGFTDHDSSNSNLSKIFYDNGSTYVSQVVPWTKKFDQITVDIDFITQTFDLTFTPDANILTPDFDPGNPSITVVSGAALTSPISTLEQMYFRTHTDPGDGVTLAGLDKSYVDKFGFTVKPVPEPATLALLALGAASLIKRNRSNFK